MGTTLLTVAITTVSPWLRPETIWVRSESDAPMVTGTVCAWPLTSVCTVSPAPEGRIALLGTVSTAVTWLITSEIEADTPAWSEGLLPVSMTVTGKVATPDENVGLLLVVDAKEHLSTAVVVKSVRELQAGDVVEMRTAGAGGGSP